MFARWKRKKPRIKSNKDVFKIHLLQDDNNKHLLFKSCKSAVIASSGVFTGWGGNGFLKGSKKVDKYFFYILGLFFRWVLN